jgi:hypothetical protein
MGGEINELPHSQDPDVLKSSQSQQVPVSSNDAVSSSGNRTFQHSVVDRIIDYTTEMDSWVDVYGNLEKLRAHHVHVGVSETKLVL